METRKIVVRVVNGLDAGQLKAELVKLTGAPEASIVNIRQAVSNTHVFIVRVAAEHFGLFLAKNGGKIQGKPVEIKAENGGDEKPMQEEKPDQAALAAANAEAGGDKKVGENGLAGQLADLGIERATLPPGPAPQPKKEEPKKTEERPPSLGRAIGDAARRGLDAGEATLRELLELEVKGKDKRDKECAQFVLETSAALDLVPRKLFPPTAKEGMRAESRPEVLNRFVETVLAGPNPASAFTMLRNASKVQFASVTQIDELTTKAQGVIERKLEDRKVVPIKAGGEVTGTDGKAF